MFIDEICIIFDSTDFCNITVCCWDLTLFPCSVFNDAVSNNHLICQML